MDIPRIIVTAYSLSAGGVTSLKIINNFSIVKVISVADPQRTLEAKQQQEQYKHSEFYDSLDSIG